MPPSRFGSCLCLALLGVAATATPARAESEGSAARQPAANEAVVVLVGAAGRDAELPPLLTELFERRGVHARISKQDGFGHQQLLGAAANGDGVLVFVVPGVGGNVGLYFRAPDGERFVVRSVLLRAGFDDVGRELVGQVVETAVASLLRSGDGLTREQAQLALTGDEPPPAPPDGTKAEGAAAQAAPQPAPKPAPAPSPVRRETALEGWFALRYGALLLETQLGVGHGPGLELGLGIKRGYLLRARVTAERDFPQSLETSLITTRFTRARLRLVADAGLPLTSRQLLLVSLGMGQDRVDVTPTRAAGSSVAPSTAFQDRAPVAHAELRYEAALGGFRLAAALGADTSLVQTHYDVARSTGRESVVKPWQLRPSASLALGFCPTWATF
jgi:catechol 2,3-dioxygenase-like lactoylglutathione lyase family enzyme